MDPPGLDPAPSNLISSGSNMPIEYEQILDQVLNTYKGILRTINDSEKYIFSCSAGSDSRIIAAILAQLRDKEGKDISNIHFRCWGTPEKDSFLHLVSRLGIENYSVHDDSLPDNYDVGNIDISPGALFPLDITMKFWRGMDIDPSGYILLTGADGEAMRYAWPAWVNNWGMHSDLGTYLTVLGKVWKGVFAPCRTYEMLNVIMRIPPRYKGIDDPRLNRDKLRTDLCFKLGVGDIPMPDPKLRYRINISNERIKFMQFIYKASKFYKRFKHKLNFRAIQDYPLCYDATKWGFAATVYEQCIQD